MGKGLIDMVNIRRKAFLRKLGKLVGMSYDIKISGNKCYVHREIKRMKKNEFKRVK